MELKVLGTVSPNCSGRKNCPGFLVSDGNQNIILDCGNGITRYLNVDGILLNSTIIISHLHKDHYGELLSLAYSSYVLHNLGILKKRVPVYIPTPDVEKIIEKYINEDGISSTRIVEKNLIDYEYLTNFGEESYLEFITYDDKTKLQIGKMTVDFSLNPHQIKAYSTRIKDENSVLVYSGDTGYQNNTLTAFAENADLLICESTFLKEQLKKKDYHLNTYEAASIAKKANVSKLLLTHFYPNIEKMEYVVEAREIFENTEAAEEEKVLKLGEMK